jgi:hypothetical protein
MPAPLAPAIPDDGDRGKLVGRPIILFPSPSPLPIKAFLLAMPRLDPGRGGCGIPEDDSDEEGGMGLGPRRLYILVAVLALRLVAFAVVPLVEMGVGGNIEGIAGREGMVVDGARPPRTLPDGIVVALLVV